jgi:hypothetical protein
LVFKLVDVAICETVSWLNLAPADVDVCQLAIIDQTNDLIGSGFEPTGGFSQSH